MLSRDFAPGLLVILLSLTGLALLPAASAATACRAGDQARVWAAPLKPAAGDPFEVLAVATDGALDQLVVTDPAGRQTTLRGVRSGGPPWGLHGGVARPTRGTYRVEALRSGRVAACAEVQVGGSAGTRGSGDWDLATQAFYAAWIERLFDAPPEQSLSFDSLAPVLRDPQRNFLHNYLGAGGRQPPARGAGLRGPALLPAHLFRLEARAAHRLPACNRGSRSSPPRCQAPVVDSGFAGSPASAKGFREVSRRLMDTVHSGSGRTGLRDEATDLYPVPLERAALWPGTVYADPYGHILVLVKWVPQAAGRPGLLLAVDAQPDNSVARKRFWEGTFLFADTPSAGPGFKAFRPLVRTSGGGARLLPNSALDGRSGLPPLFDRAGGAHPRGLLRPHGAPHQPPGTGPRGGL